MSARREIMFALLKTSVFTLIVPFTVAGYVPLWLIAPEGSASEGSLGGFRFLGLVPLGFGALVYFWCAWDFSVAGRGTPAPIDPPKALVARGLYRHARNPMYVGVLSVIVGEAVFLSSLSVAIYAAFVFTIFHLFIVFYEEPTLREKFGDSYESYRASVPRWLPRLRPPRSPR